MARKRPRAVQVNLSEEERGNLKTLAQREGLTVSAWMRRQVLLEWARVFGGGDA